MNRFSHTPVSTLIRLLFIASCLTTTVYAADELKDISQMVEQGQTSNALDKLNSYIVANPKNPQAMFMKGVLLAGQGRRDEAIKVFNDMTEKFPNLPEPYNNLAVLYADQGQFDKARKALESAIKTHPSYATAHENLGDIYARMASEAYDKALQLDVNNTNLQGKLSLIKDLFSPMAAKSSSVAKSDIAKIEAPARSMEDNKMARADMPMKKPMLDKPMTNKSAGRGDMAVGAEDMSINKMNADSNATEREAIVQTVNAWAQAWSDKNLTQYFASYSDTFAPAKGMSKKDWEKQRTDRITKPSGIKVEISKVNVTIADDANASVRFKQKYVADKKSTIYTTKTLVMKKINNHWLIEQEIASN